MFQQEKTVPQLLHEAQAMLLWARSARGVPLHDSAGQSHTLVADVHPWSRNQLSHVRFTLATERARQPLSLEHVLPPMGTVPGDQCIRRRLPTGNPNPHGIEPTLGGLFHETGKQ